MTPPPDKGSHPAVVVELTWEEAESLLPQVMRRGYYGHDAWKKHRQVVEEKVLAAISSTAEAEDKA